MLRILYAADNRKSSFYSLKRFLETYNKYYIIKVAAYSKSTDNLNINWNLDALLDFRSKSNSICFKNANIALYKREITKFKPHVIISDLEIYSSCIGLDLGIPIWQVSPLLLYYGSNESFNIYKNYSSLFKINTNHHKYIKYILNNSDKKLIISHLGDANCNISLKKEYNWVRPNYLYKDNSNNEVMVSNGINLADFYYAGQKTFINIDYSDIESITTGLFNYNKNLSNLKPTKNTNISIKIDNNIKFLSQYLNDIVI